MVWSVTVWGCEVSVVNQTCFLLTAAGFRVALVWRFTGALRFCSAAAAASTSNADLLPTPLAAAALVTRAADDIVSVGGVTGTVTVSAAGIAVD